MHTNGIKTKFQEIGTRMHVIVVKFVYDNRRHKCQNWYHPCPMLINVYKNWKPCNKNEDSEAKRKNVRLVWLIDSTSMTFQMHKLLHICIRVEINSMRTEIGRIEPYTKMNHSSYKHSQSKSMTQTIQTTIIVLGFFSLSVSA